jgi:hypothetical protein
MKLAISLTTLSVSLASAMAASNPKFPSLTAADLNKQEVRLPGGLSGDWNLLLIAFQREQQKDIDTWLPVLPAVVQKHPNLAYYELPVISRMNFMMRWFVNTGMRNGIPDKQQRGRTITLYLDKKPFRDTLQIPSEDNIYALLVNKAGEVVWRTEGTVSEEKLRSLENFLNAR